MRITFQLKTNEETFLNKLDNALACYDVERGTTQKVDSDGFEADRIASEGKLCPTELFLANSHEVPCIVVNDASNITDVLLVLYADEMEDVIERESIDILDNAMLPQQGNPTNKPSLIN